MSGAVPPLMYMTMTYTGTAHTLCTSSVVQKKGNHDSEVTTSMVLMHHFCLNQQASVALLYCVSVGGCIPQFDLCSADRTVQPAHSVSNVTTKCNCHEV
jgi:hypothetical protein